MANTLRVEIVSPERILYSGEATMVVTRTLDGGEIAFQAGHAPYLAALTESYNRIYLADGTMQGVAVHGGFVQVANNTVSLLCDVAELSQEIDVTRAQVAVERAQASLAKTQDIEHEAALRRAHARLAAAGGMATPKTAH
jgi:F-type H+-transporting ATPase subunit epsilon